MTTATFDSHCTYFLSMEIENVRCFGPRQTLDLSDGEGGPARWTVLLGDNGVGKTTVLQWLVALSPRVKTKKHNKTQVVTPSYLLLLMDGTLKSGLLSFCRKSDTKSTGKSILIRRWNLSQPKLDRATRATITASYTADGHPSGGGSGFGPVWSDEPDYLMTLIAYGASRRMATTSLTDDPTDAAASLFDDNAPLINAEEWLLQADYAAKSTESARARRRYDQVKSILVSILPDVDDLRIVGLDQQPPRPTVEAKTPYGWVSIRRLSLGYKALMAWMVDLAARLLDTYPDEENPLHGPAVVLVDEIDLHLHPTWQRKLMGYLSERFPNVQFIVTAHSPLIVQAAADANLAVLRREGDHVLIDNDPRSVRGWSVDQLLTSDLFGLQSARPPQLDKLLAERKELLRKDGLTAQDEERLSVIEAELEALPYGEDEDEIEARDLIRRFAASVKELEER